MKTSAFTFGAVAGASGLLLSVPLLVQFAGAASSNGTSFAPPAPSATCIQALAARDGALVGSIDGLAEAARGALVTHQEALEDAAELTDDTERREAVHAAQEDFHAALKAAFDATGLADERDALEEACDGMLPPGGPFGFGGRHMMGRGGGMMIEKLAERFGIDSAELQERLKNGETPEQIAEEYGIELPTRPIGKGFGHGRMGGPGMMPFDDEATPPSSDLE